MASRAQRKATSRIHHVACFGSDLPEMFFAGVFVQPRQRMARDYCELPARQEHHFRDPQARSGPMRALPDGLLEPPLMEIGTSVIVPRRNASRHRTETTERSRTSRIAGPMVRTDAEQTWRSRAPYRRVDCRNLGAAQRSTMWTCRQIKLRRSNLAKRGPALERTPKYWP